MIIGIGTDIIEVKRVWNAVKKEAFRRMIYSAEEIEYCAKDKNGVRYAARFAAKEAFLKAMGVGLPDTFRWSEIAIINDSKGKPEIKLSGKALALFKLAKGKTIHVSLSHIKEMAIAYVVVEGSKKGKSKK